MLTFTNPIRYSNQDFDEYQAARRHLGPDHTDWFVKQPKHIRDLRISGAWFANLTEALYAYQAVERWHHSVKK